MNLHAVSLKHRVESVEKLKPILHEIKVRLKRNKSSVGIFQFVVDVLGSFRLVFMHRQKKEMLQRSPRFQGPNYALLKTSQRVLAGFRSRSLSCMKNS